MHFELFTRTLAIHEKEVLVARGKMAALACDMANTRTTVRLGLDQLAYQMAIKKDKWNLFGVSKLNIQNLDHFDETIHNLEDIDKLYADKNNFTQEVINRSIELRAVDELYRISKLNIGVTAAGQILGPGEGYNPQFIFSLNYQSIPQILMARSNAQTSKIDVNRQLLNMINFARTSYDTYKYNFGLYVEARRSLIINRKAVKATLDSMIYQKTPMDGVFLNAVTQLIDAHLKLNSAVHSALGALAFMRRLMVTEEKKILTYIPIDKKVNSAIELFMETYGKEVTEDQHLDSIMRKIRKECELRKLLNGFWKIEAEPLKKFADSKVQEAVVRNMKFLLYKKWNFRKSKAFFKILRMYIERHGLDIHPFEEKKLHDLTKKSRFFRK